jgi:CRP-like cAMP-binding protein
MDATKTPNHQANELYASLSPQLVALLRECESEELRKAGTALIRHGKDLDQLVIVCSGQVLISLPSGGDSVLLGNAGAGKVLGLRALVSGELPEIDAFCIRDCAVATISRSRFMELLNKHPEIYSAIAKVLSADLKLAEHHLKNVSRNQASRAPKNSC